MYRKHVRVMTIYSLRASDPFYRDMIDTENADGDFYKMFLGSILEDMDNKLIQGGGGADALSVHTPMSASTFESSTAGSKRVSGSSQLLHQLPSRTSTIYRSNPSTYAP